MDPDQTAHYAPFDQVHTGRIRSTIVVTSGLRVNIPVIFRVSSITLPKVLFYTGNARSDTNHITKIKENIFLKQMFTIQGWTFISAFWSPPGRLDFKI